LWRRGYSRGLLIVLVAVVLLVALGLGVRIGGVRPSWWLLLAFVLACILVALLLAIFWR